MSIVSASARVPPRLSARLTSGGSDDADAIRSHFAGNLRGRVDCNSFVECAQLLRVGRTIHYRGAFSRYEAWRGTEPGSGVFDIWTMGFDARPVLAPPAGQIPVP